MKRPQLVVIPGDRISLPPWLNLRRTVLAKSPLDPTTPVIFRIAQTDVRKAFAARRRQPIFDLWSVVFGEPPPVPNVEWQGNSPHAEGLTCLAEAHACFRGIRRPIGEDDDGDNVLIYVLRPRAHYVYQPHMVTVAHRRAVPSDVVFAVYARLDQPFDPKPNAITGVVTHWQFVEGTAETGEILPISSEERYRDRLW